MTVFDSASLHKFLVHFTDTLTPELADTLHTWRLEANDPPRVAWSKAFEYACA